MPGHEGRCAVALPADSKQIVNSATRRRTDMTDQDVIKHIEELIAEEQRLYGVGHLSDEEKLRLQAMQVQLDQYWDLLRQRRALRDAGKDPDKAELRDPDTVENYEN
jgi:hypothetical protein